MSRLSDDDVLWMIHSPRYDRDVRALAQELRERRANDLTPDQLVALRRARSIVWSSPPEPEIASVARDAIDAVLRAHREKP